METKNLLNKKITQWLLLVAMLVGCSASAWATNEFGQRYFYVDCTGFTSYPSVNCSFFWGNNDVGSCNNEAGYKKGMATCATNVYYHDLSTVSSGSYTYLRGFQVSQGEWYDKSCHVPASSGNKKNCVKITGWGKGDWSTYVLTPSAVTLKVTSGASGGSGTSSDPYIVEPGASFTLSASGVTYSPSDPNMSTRYGFGTSASSTPTGTSSTSTQTASSSEETKQYYVSVRGYYNSTYSSSYKSTSVYVQTKSACVPPTAYNVSGPSSVCAGSNAEITLSGSQTGYTYELYKDGATTSTTQAGTGSSLTFSAKVSGSSAAAFTIKGYVTGTPTCTADMNGTATVTPIALPSAPSGSNINVCSGSDAVFTASQTNNRCIDWYTASTGGTKLATCQTSYTKTNLTSDYTVYVEARNADNGCVSQSRTAIKATAVAKPTIASTAPASGCIGTNVNIGATASSGATVRWYEASTGGTALYTGTPYTVSSISATKTYYAEAYNSTLDCASTSRTGVTATAKALNNVSNITFYPASIKKGDTTEATATVTTVGGTGAWSTSTPSLISFSSTSANPTTITANGIGTAKVTYTLTGGCSGTNYKTVDLVINSDCDAPNAGTISGNQAICAGGSVSLSVTGYTSTNTTLQWNKNGSPVAGKTSNTYTESNVTESATYTVTVTRTDVDNCSATTPTGYEVTVTQIPSITTHNDNSRCGTGTVTLSAAASAGDVKWYSASTGGTALKTGTSYTTPSISTTTTYYVDATQNGCTTASRTAVTATVNTVPSIGSISKSEDACGAGNITFQANSVTAGATVTWYENSSSLGTGNSYTFTAVPAGTSHSVTAKATLNGCTSSEKNASASRLAVPTLTINAPTAYAWEDATFTYTSDGSVTGSVTQKTGTGGIISGDTFKGHVGDVFTGSYTATNTTTGCTTSDSADVTVTRATESCD